MRVVALEDMDSGLWRAIVRLYRSQPLRHVYLLYDLIYEEDRTEAYFAVEGGEVMGYLLLWRGSRALGAHLWGRASDLIAYIPRGDRMILQLYGGELVGAVSSYLGAAGSAEVRVFVDMVVDERGFKPYSPERAVRLREDDPHHVGEFIKIKSSQGVPLDPSTAGNLIRAGRYYGVFEGPSLASIARSYVRMPEVWVIGDVYTHPSYRGKGYAKIATSAITRDCIASGAMALLHVESSNDHAIRVYRALGYEAISQRPWIFYTP